MTKKIFFNNILGMKKLNKFDFLLINKRMNGNWNGGVYPFIGKTKKITKGEEFKILRKLQKIK